MTSQGELSRRSLLSSATKIAVAGVAVSLGACSQVSSAARAEAAAADPKATHDVQSYRSRPDFHPPRVVTEVHRKGTSPGLILTDCHGGSSQQGGMIFDETGELIWYKPVSNGGTPSLRLFNLRVQSYRGEPVLCWWEGAVVAGHGEGHYVLADSHYRTIATVQAKNGLKGDLHEFVLTDKGTALFTAFGTASADLSAYGGSSAGAYFFGEVQEVDIATGELVFSWRSDTHVGFEDSYAHAPKDPQVPWDYFHLNSINVDPVDSNLVISSRNTWCVYKIERHSGKILWRLGGKASDFALAPDARFAYQHDVCPYENGTLTIFDNAGSPWVNPPSRGLVLALDEARRTAVLVREYLHHPPVDSPALGSVQDLSDGHVFMGWGTSTYFSEYGPSAELLLDGRLQGRRLESYRAFKQPWVGAPLEPPAVALRASAARVDVYVSWNGATEVDSWRLLAGHGRDALSSVGRVRRTGFETAITLRERPAYVAVEALDSKGSVLARSRVLRT